MIDWHFCRWKFSTYLILIASSRTWSPKNLELGFWDCSMIESALCQRSGDSCSCIKALLACARCGEIGSYAAPTIWSNKLISKSPLRSFWANAWRSPVAVAIFLFAYVATRRALMDWSPFSNTARESMNGPRILAWWLAGSVSSILSPMTLIDFKIESLPTICVCDPFCKLWCSLNCLFETSKRKQLDGSSKPVLMTFRCKLARETVTTKWSEGNELWFRW